MRWLSLQRWRETWACDIFGIDLRSLALFRIALGFVIILDLIGRSASLGAHYTDAGVLPRGTVMSTLNQWRWSVLLANGTLAFQTILFMLTATAAILLIVGFRARLMTVIVWALVISIQVRNPLLLSGADTLMRVLLFWAMFLPLGARWSIDSSRHSPRTTLAKPISALSFGTAGLLLQIAFMYWFTAFLKSSTVWTSEGTALYYALSAGHVARPSSEFLLQFPVLLRVGTHATLIVEFLAPALLFSPFFRGPIRTLATASIISLHLGIMLTMDLGVFSMASALCMVCFLPTWFWDVLIPKVQESSLARRLPMLHWRHSRVPRPLAQAFSRFRWMLPKQQNPKVMGADHDSQYTASAPPVTPQKRILTASYVGNILAALSLVFVFAWNISTVSAFTVPKAYQPVAYGVGLYQKWNMFAPKPPALTQWYVVQGLLENGQELDLLTPIVYNDVERIVFVSWDRPDNIVTDYYGNKYWRKYFEAIGKSGHSTERLKFAAYSCRTWNGHYGGDVALDRVEIYRLTQRTLLSGEEAEINQTLIGDYGCT